MTKRIVKPRKPAEICSGNPLSKWRPLNILLDEDGEEFVTAYTWFIADKSGSVKIKENPVFNALSNTFAGLDEANTASLDVVHRVKLALFDSDIRDFNSVHLEPKQLADTFTPDDFRCSGSTNMGAVFRYIDKELSRNSPVVRSLKKNTPMFNFIIVTDAMANDPVAVRAEAQKLLESNRFYKNYCRVLVVFLGDEKDKAGAVALAGGREKNVVTLDDDLVTLLAPVLINSTVTFTDGTHLNGTGEQTIADVTKQAKERAEDGKTSADEVTDEQLRDELLRLMGKVS